MTKQSKRYTKMPIATRSLDKETFDKTEKYLRQAGRIEDKNLHGRYLALQENTDDEQVLDALIHLQKNKMNIEAIWIMEDNPKKGMMTAKNFHGEKGSYAKMLGEKYLNCFFEQLATVDIDNIKDQQYVVTVDVIKKVEAGIDQHIDPDHITETEVNAYDRIELILSAKQALIHLCTGLGEEDYEVSYVEDAHVFEVAFHSSDLDIRVPLGDVVRKKWETGESFAKAALICGGDLYLIADERKKKEAHYTKELLKLVMPDLRKIAGQDEERFESLKNHYIDTIKNQIMLYDEGRKHNEAGHEKWSRVEFLAQHDELSPHKNDTNFVNMLYSAYCDGFAKLNGDYLLSGKGGIRLPVIL